MHVDIRTGLQQQNKQQQVFILIKAYSSPIMATKANIVDTAVMTRSNATSSFRLRSTS